MKKHLYNTIIFLFFMANCSNTLFAQSSKDKVDAVNDYFETIAKDSAKKIIVIKEKISANMTIHIVNLNEIDPVSSNGKGKEDKMLYNEKDWKIMKKRYENPLITKKDNWLENKYWTPNDFRYKGIIFESIKGRSWEDISKKYDSESNLRVYYFSDPIYYKKDKYLVFTVYESYLVGGGGSNYIVFMQKRQGKWVVTHKGATDWRS